MTSTAGVVFAGGSSRRMGADKSLLPVAGVPLIQRVLDAMVGLDTTCIIGGREEDLASLGVGWRADAHPGEGPLGALVTAFAATDAEVLVTAACDLPYLQTSTIDALLAHRSSSAADVAVPLIGGRMQWHVTAWHRRSEAAAARAFSNGERSLHRVGRGLAATAVVFASTADFVDLDTPADVRREFPG